MVSDNGTAAPVERILANHGANYVRLRLWVNPQGGRSDLQSTLELARRSHAAGLKLLLDLHYSDSWADRTTQQIPAAWQGQSEQGLRSTVETYSRDAVAALARQGTPADIVQIGNEVTRGCSGPTDGFTVRRVKHGQDSRAPQSRAAGARAGNPGQVPRIMVHADTAAARSVDSSMTVIVQQESDLI